MLVRDKLMVGMAEIKVAQDQAVYHCLGLGSCIGLVLLDPHTNISGMVHIMLPESFKNRVVDKLGKFADTGVPELLSMMIESGASRRRLIAAYSGGASIFQYGNGDPNLLDIGSRNAKKVAELVDALGIPVVATDTGGSMGRSMMVCTKSGDVRVKTIRQGEVTLCNLRG